MQFLNDLLENVSINDINNSNNNLDYVIKTRSYYIQNNYTTILYNVFVIMEIFMISQELSEIILDYGGIPISSKINNNYVYNDIYSKSIRISNYIYTCKKDKKDYGKHIKNLNLFDFGLNYRHQVINWNREIKFVKGELYGFKSNYNPGLNIMEEDL